MDCKFDLLTGVHGGGDTLGFVTPKFSNKGNIYIDNRLSLWRLLNDVHEMRIINVG